jgi:PAS domain S-box-containing protein
MHQLFRSRAALHSLNDGRPQSDARQRPGSDRRYLDPRTSPFNFGIAVLIGVAYYAGTRIGFLLTPYPDPISTLWPPNAILFAGLLLAQQRIWWLVVLAVLPAHLIIQLQTGVPILTSLGWLISNTGEALIGAFCLRRFSERESLFKSFRGVSAFLVFGVIFAPFVTSFLDAAIVVMSGWGINYWLLWRERLLSNMLANLTLVPAIMLIGSGAVAWVRKSSHWMIFEAVILTVGIVLTANFVFGGQTALHSSNSVLIYAPLPLLLWAAVRFGPGGVSAGLLIIALLSIWNAIHGRGPFAADTAASNVYFLQIFLILIQVPLIYLAALIEERKQVTGLLRASEERYRNVVETQTELICRYLSDTTLTFVNDAYCRYFGKSCDELVGTKFIEFIPESARAATLKHIESLIVRPRVEVNEHEVVRPDGSKGWQRWIDRVILDPAGLVVELQGVGSDFTDLKQAEESLQHLTARLLNIQDEERRRIALELHDGTAQNLFALTVKLAGLERSSHSWPAEERKSFEESLALGEQALQEIRTLSYLLHPPLLDQAGLVSALRWYVEGFSMRSGIFVDVIVPEELGRLSPELETALFRIVQEGLTNIQRHSGSDTASIRVERSKDQVILQIADQGAGMLIETAQAAGDFRSVGVGLRGIRQRLSYLGGRLEIDSCSQGTTVTAIVPIAREERNGSHLARR